MSKDMPRDADLESDNAVDDDLDKQPSQEDDDDLFLRLKSWFREDFDAASDWREQAREDFAFVSGDQWAEEDKAKLRAEMRPIITMNRIDTVIDSVSGSEVANRQEVRYIPREQGDVKVNELYTSAAQWFRDQCDAEDEESDAFRDTIICGMGWVETRLDYETEPDGEPRIERVDPLEVVADHTSRKRNLSDMRRVFHIRRNIPIDEARAITDAEGDLEDSDYNATWAGDSTDDDTDGDGPSINDHKSYDGKASDGRSEAPGTSHDKRVTLVRAMWWERETIYRVVDPTDPSKITTLTADEYRELKARFDKVSGGQRLDAVKALRRVYRQAYLGAKMLSSGDAPCKEHFSFHCITGKRDRNNNSWYGLVRGMKDPQRWANKWLAQSLHILNSSAKGGLLAERGAFDNDKDAEQSWANQDVITFAKQGALAANKIQPKPVSPMPAGFYNLMEFAIRSIRDVSGVNVETLGMRDATQAASLEVQRKQSAMTILQPLFDSLRRYRKMQGRLLLYLIEKYLSDGRLVRIVGQDNEQYMPLRKAEGVSTYDVIVDDAPTSPNQKEATWSMLQQLLPVIGPMLPVDTWMALLEFSPLPSSAQDKIKKSIEEKNAQPPPPDPKIQELEFEQARNQSTLQFEQAKQQMTLEAKERESQMVLQSKERAFQMEYEKKRVDHDLDLQHKVRDGEAAPVGALGNVLEAIHDAIQTLSIKVREGEAPPAGVEDVLVAIHGSLQDLSQQNSQMLAYQAAPAEIIRGPDGRVIGASKVLPFRPPPAPPSPPSEPPMPAPPPPMQAVQ